MRWIIGDIHGMLRPLTGLVELIQKQDATAQIFCVGDYVNRGPESCGVVDFLRKRPEVRLCRGNHDDIFDNILNGQCFERHPQLFTPVDCFRAFIQHGLDQTLISYGVDPADIQKVSAHPTAEGLKKLIEPIPKEHREFFRTLPAVQEEPEFFVIHAKWETSRADSHRTFTQTMKARAAMRHGIIWSRYDAREIHRGKNWTRIGFFGHTPVPNYPLGTRTNAYEPIVGEKMVLLDTASALAQQGRLTAWCFEESRFIQADRAGQAI